MVTIQQILRDVGPTHLQISVGLQETRETEVRTRYTEGRLGELAEILCQTCAMLCDMFYIELKTAGLVVQRRLWCGIASCAKLCNILPVMGGIISGSRSPGQ